jgi:ABC-type multidrug transport system fused ATPase/permease subunit
VADTEASALSAIDSLSTAELLSRLSEQSSRLVRNELRLMLFVLTKKAKRLGLGVGMFGAAGLVAVCGIGTLVTTAILALALVVDAWLAALIVTAILLAVAGVLALVGRKQVSHGLPPAPEQSIASVKQDIETVKESASRDKH